MGEKTSIAWTDATFNPWWICTEVSPGCDNCYARVLANRYGYGWGKGIPRRSFGDNHWARPLNWDKKAKAAGVKLKVFCASMADVMDDEAPSGQRERLWELIEKTPNLIWQLLTKRPQRYAKYLPLFNCPKNIWLGTSTENQENYDLRWPILQRAADARGLTTFISYEPALGPLRLNGVRGGFPVVPDWVIAGGESGPNRRPSEQKWFEDVLGDCQLMGSKFFMKQFSARTPEQGTALIPASLLIRQFPTKP